MPSLFDPICLGAILAPNRVLMAPLTRGRADRGHVPTPMMARYYAQRATAGLIITEATGISQEGLGWPYAPGLWSDEQVAGWKPVTEAVHVAGGRIAAQLWHMGRVVHPSFLDGGAPVSASPTTAPGQAHTYQGRLDYARARALEVGEIPRLIDDYRRAAHNAVAAGFDGIQVHAANGYLIDQFLRDRTNLRLDGYGGPVECRVRLLREVTEAVAQEVGADRVSVRLSPNGEVKGADDSDPVQLFTEAARVLSATKIAFLELREPRPDGTFAKPSVPPVAPSLRAEFKGILVLNSDYVAEDAHASLARGEADAISFGRPFIANPDLPERLRRGAPLTRDSMSTWYSQGEEGYVDYPTLNDG